MAKTKAIAKFDPFSAMDVLDEKAFLEEMSGRVVKEYVYEFTQGGQKIRGLSKPGVDAVCRHLADKGEVIRELALEVTVDRTVGEALFRCHVGRFKIVPLEGGGTEELLLDTAFGVKRQELFFTKRTGERSPDPHWYEKGAMKAARNGRRRMIPEAVATEMIAGFAKEGRARRVEAPADGPEPKKPAAPAFDRAAAMDALQNKLDEVIGNDNPIPFDDTKMDIIRACWKVETYPELNDLDDEAFVARKANWAKAVEEVLNKTARR